MMNYKLTAVRTVLPIIMVALFSYTAQSQAITKAAAIAYTNGIPIHTPSSVGSEVAINTVNKDFYFWNGTAWVNNTGTGAFVRTTSPTLVTPNLGVATATTINKVTLTAPATGSTITIADGKVLTSNNTLTFTGTDASSIAFGVGGNVAYQNQVNTFTQNQVLTLPDLTGSSATNGINITQTWNTTGAPSLIYGNVTHTASGQTSSLINLQRDGSSRFKVSPYGSVTAGSGLLSTLSATASNQYGAVGSNYYIDGNNATKRSVADVASALHFNGGGFEFQTSGNGVINSAISWSQLAFLNGNGIFTITPFANTATTGTVNSFSHTASFAPTSGTAVWNQMTLAPVINQTGGANGITRGLYINPTLTAAVDFRAIETTSTYNATSGTQQNVLISPTFAANTGSANFRPLSISYTVNNSGVQSGNATGILLNTVETVLNGMTNTLLDLQRNGSSRFRVSNLGYLTVETGGGAASSSAILTSGAWHTGSGTTNTKPHVLIEASGATSTGWSTAGTGLGVNSTSSFTSGNLIDLQQNGISRFRVEGTSSVTRIDGNGLNCGNTITATDFSSGSFGYSISSFGRLTAQSTGIFTFFNSGSSNFERLQFGGTTSSFPALQTASSNAQTALTATFVNGNANITTATNTFAANDVVQFTTTGALPTGFAINTDYFVIATGLTTTNIQVSATTGGAAITAGSAGSGTHTVVRQNSATIPNGSSTWTSTFAHGLRVGDIIRFTASNLPNGFTAVEYYVLSVPTITTFTLSATFGGSAITATSLVTTAMGFTRPAAIYLRTADNSGLISLNTGNITTVGTSTVTGNISVTTGVNISGTGGSLSFGNFTNLTSSASGLLRIVTGGNNNFNRLQLGPTTSLGPAFQTSTLVTATAVFTNASSTITTSSMTLLLSAGDIVTFSNSGGALPTSISTNTQYYVVGTPTTTAIQVASTFGGTAIVHNGAGTGTHTVTRVTAMYIRNGDNSAFIPIATGKQSFDATNTASGTPGDQTINKPSGTVNFAAGIITSLVVTNSLVSSSSIVYAVVRTNDTTATIKNVVPANGSFTINLTAGPTAETSVGFVVFN